MNCRGNLYKSAIRKWRIALWHKNKCPLRRNSELFSAKLAGKTAAPHAADLS